MSTIDYEGALFVEVFKVYEEMYCSISNRKFQAFRKARSNSVADAENKAELALQFEIAVNECECKAIKFGLADLSRVMKASKLSETPYFFSVTAQERTYMFAAATEDLRTAWIRMIRTLSKPREKKPDTWVSTGFLEGNYPKEGINRFSAREGMPSNRAGTKAAEKGIDADSSSKRISTRKTKSEDKEEPKEDISLSPSISKKSFSTEIPGNNSPEDDGGREDVEIEITGDMDDDLNKLICCQKQEKILGLKIDTIIRLLKVCTAFPFVIVVSSLNLSNKYTWLRSLAAIRIMNILIYVAPVIYVEYVLSRESSDSVQRVTIGLYILLYLLPVAYVVATKVQVSASTSKIEEGTFCFKPARIVRVTQANFYAIFGFIMEWLQHILYVIPLGILTNSATKLSDFPPYLSYEVYFWICVVSTFLCGLIIILNAILKGKLHYKFQNSYLVWFFLFNVGSPMFATVVTLLFMSLWCDYSTNPPTLVQQPDIVCYSDRHVVMARAGLIAVAIYIIQHTLLPSGTFKETMRDEELEIMFVPVYLQAHYLLKAVFCGVYVLFYEDNYTRVITLTVINMIILTLNNYMKPCSVGWVNLLRDGFFVHATLSGIISLNYLAWPDNASTKGMVISTLASTVLFSTVGLLTYYYYTKKSTEYAIASAFLDLEWQVSRGGSVHPRVLEPLISLTLSSNKEDWDIAKKYIGQLVWLISYPNMRVQFQSAWGLANLALLDEDARMKIHDAGGTKSLFEWYTEMDFVVQLEVLAAMANLTLSAEVSEIMVTRHKCIVFFIDLVASNKLKHSQFAAIALSNLARRESYREQIRKNGGISALVTCLLSHNYQKRRHGCRALANMALSPTKEIEQVFESKGLIDRILKMALRKEIETQREVVALIRNLSCHARLRPLLLDRGVMNAVEASKLSVFEDVRVWCDEITALLQRELSSGAIDLKALLRREGAKGSNIGETDVELLKRMEPLQGRVEWSTWGSKLESIFEPVFSQIPNLLHSQISTNINQPITILLPNGISKQELQKWRDTLSYVVDERPVHGKLNEYNTFYDYVTYTPAPDYVGSDFFTYHMNVGTSSTAPTTVAIKIIDPDNPTTSDAADVPSDRRTRRLFRRKSEQDPNANAAAVKDLEAGKNSPRRPPWVKSTSGKSSPIPKPRESEFNTIEMENIYGVKNKSNDSPTHSTPFIENLMRKTSGSEPVKRPTSDV